MAKIDKNGPFGWCGRKVVRSPIIKIELNVGEPCALFQDAAIADDDEMRRVPEFRQGKYPGS